MDMKIYAKLKPLLGKIRVIESQPPHEDEGREPVPHFMRPYAPTPDARRRLLRTQIFASIASVLHEVAAKRPRVMVGIGQGSLVVLMCSRPLVVEAAARASLLVASEMRRICSAWGSLVALISISPMIMPQKSLFEDVVAAIPEFLFEQPRGLMVVLVENTIRGLRQQHAAKG